MAKRTQTPLLTVSISNETDLLLARRRATEIARLLSMDKQDQTRIATAVSEIVRNAYSYATGGRVEYYVDRTPRLSLRIVVQDRGPGIAQLDSILGGTYQSQTGMGLGILGAKRLSDWFDLVSGPKGTRVTLVKHGGGVPASHQPPTDAELLNVLTTSRASDAVTVLVDQNQELMQLLEQLRLREAELGRLNQELEETNRGVMVLYSELEDKAESVQQANEMKSRFLSAVTHELRTPLNSIVSLSRLLLEHTDGDLNPEQEKQVGFILRSAQNLTELVNDLLDLAKVEAGKVSVRSAPVSVADVFSALRGMFRPIAQSDRVEFRVEIPARDLHLNTDEGKISQILRNFISNALKFTELGEVVLSARQEESFIVFSVADTGLGIAPENRELVLQEWAQVEGAHSSKHRGSGLGLPLAKKFTELLGGEMWFDSELGKGSSFHIRLPIGDIKDIHHPSAQPVGSGEDALGEIVVVDDDEVARYLVRRQLATLTSARVFEAGNGRQGLELIRSRKPALAVLDVMMPEMNGIDLAQALRRDPALENLRILVITSKVLTEAEQALLSRLDAEVLGRKGTSDEEQRVVLERALLHVGLHNLHQGTRTA
jgi:signal transduction histidine kinase/CheY-like chemotaxis protein